jgi:hypothetical protein
MSEEVSAGATRREVLVKGAFVAPVILTLAAVPSFASAGSSGARDEDGQGGSHKQHAPPHKDGRPGRRHGGPWRD